MADSQKDNRTKTGVFASPSQLAESQAPADIPVPAQTAENQTGKKKSALPLFLICLAAALCLGLILYLCLRPSSMQEKNTVIPQETSVYHQNGFTVTGSDTWIVRTRFRDLAAQSSGDGVTLEKIYAGPSEYPNYIRQTTSDEEIPLADIESGYELMFRVLYTTDAEESTVSAKLILKGPASDEALEQEILLKLKQEGFIALETCIFDNAVTWREGNWTLSLTAEDAEMTHFSWTIIQ